MKVQFVLSLSLMLLSAVSAQRGSYAGKRPVYHENKGDFPTEATAGLNNRFGADNDLNGYAPQPQQLPVDALGDYAYYNRVNQLPYWQQPFWLLNYQQIEAHRNQPQLSGGVFVNRGSFSGTQRRR
jgi:hypothetical protein